MRRIIQKYSCSFAILASIVACSGNDEGAKTTVERGAYNQPSISVKSAPPGQADLVLFEQQGYVEAQDRFLQMDMLRRVSQGRISEIFGKAARSRDLQMIAVGLPLSATRSLEKIQTRYPETLAVLEAFARGVNKFIAEQVRGNTDLLRTYRRWTNQHYVMDLWKPIDSISVAESIAFFLSSNIQERIMVGKIASAYFNEEGFTKLPQLFDMRPVENTFILQAGGELAGAVPQAATLGKGKKNFSQHFTVGGQCIEKEYPFPPCTRQGSYGSNNWVVSRQHAGGNKAFLANDPHLQLSFPNNFIELALDSTLAGGTIKARGVNLPGVPGVLIGHNQYIAWGITNNPADVDEVYIEELTPDSRSIKLNPGGDKLAAILDNPYVLKIRQVDGSLHEEAITLRETKEHGMFVSDHFEELKPATDKVSEMLTPEGEPKAKIALSYKWVGHKGTTEMAAILRLNKARNFDEFKSALQLIQAGAQNFVYADVSGHIGYYSHGDFPIRRFLKETLPPNVPLFGFSDGQLEWEPEYRSEKQIPSLLDPVAGRIVTANNDPFGGTGLPNFSDYKDYFGNGFDVGTRAKRITDLLDEKRGNLDLADMQRIQLDTKDLFALKAVRLMSQAKVQTVLELSPRAKALKDSLIAYDGEARREREEPAQIQTWLRALGKVYFKELLDKYATLEKDPEAGRKASDELFEELVNGLLAAKTIYHKMNDLLAMDPPDPEAIKMIQESLEKASEEIENNRQTWGATNRLAFFSPLTGIFPSVATAPIERNGSWATVNVAGKIHGPNFRLIMVLEEGKPIEGVNVLAGGNYSPLQGSKWLNELMLWRDGKYRDLVPFAQ